MEDISGELIGGDVKKLLVPISRITYSARHFLILLYEVKGKGFRKIALSNRCIVKVLVGITRTKGVEETERERSKPVGLGFLSVDNVIS